MEISTSDRSMLNMTKAALYRALDHLHRLDNEKLFIALEDEAVSIDKIIGEIEKYERKD